MSIKSDHWIRRMAEQQQMIAPFEAGQVRYAGDDRVISYGTMCAVRMSLRCLPMCIPKL
jgi:deoxycytidine triphosphate deaminase